MQAITLLLSIIVSASIDSTALMIGDQCRLRLEAEGEAGTQIVLPHYEKELIPGIEIVHAEPADTTESNGRIRIRQNLTITGWEDTLYAIAPLPFVGNGETIYSAPMALNVYQPFQMDTTDAIADIKPNMEAPTWWWETARWFVLAALLLLTAGAGYALYRYLQRRKKHTADEVEEDTRPAEVVALERLDVIRETKVWKQGRTKDYHTELTDIVREYISRRFEVQSTEQTSGETLDALRPEMREQKALYDRLSKMLRLADLVKFARWQATPEENEQSLNTAYDFVNETTEKGDDKVEIKDNRNKV